MRRWSAFIAALLAGVFGIWYCWLAWNHRIEPSLATWIIFESAIVISFITYVKNSKRTSGGANLVSNIGNTTDVITASLILLTLVICGNKEQWHFQIFDVWCLLASGAILLFRTITKKEAAANLAIQLVMVAAYLPTMHKMWAAERITESLGLWTVQWTICALSFFVAIADKNFLAAVYSGRATALVTILIGLMIRLKLKQG